SADTFNSRQLFVLRFFTVVVYGYLIFGSGTKLLVTDEQVVKPVVSVYPAASRAHLEGKSSLLCLASAMFPPLVKFSWKRQKEDGDPEEVHRDVGDPEKLKESGCTASILLIHQHESSTYKYRCSVQHEGGTVEAQTEQASSSSNINTANINTSTFIINTSTFTINNSTFTINTININTSTFRTSTCSFSSVSVQGEAVVSAVHSADREESGVLLWTLSADDPQKQGTVHQLHTC
ncbi:Immunoglobulin lambda-1 light chain, partial [Nibea albiflora]